MTRRSHRTRDAGRVSVFTTVLVAAVLAVAGLVLDGGLALAGKTRAYSIASDAARTGAQHIDLTLYLSTGQVALDPDAARAAATARLEQIGATGQASATTTQVTVTVEISQPTQLLALFGIATITTEATATAAPVHGLNTPGGGVP